MIDVFLGELVEEVSEGIPENILVEICGYENH